MHYYSYTHTVGFNGVNPSYRGDILKTQIRSRLFYSRFSPGKNISILFLCWLKCQIDGQVEISYHWELYSDCFHSRQDSRNFLEDAFPDHTFSRAPRCSSFIERFLIPTGRRTSKSPPSFWDLEWVKCSNGDPNEINPFLKAGGAWVRRWSRSARLPGWRYLTVGACPHWRRSSWQNHQAIEA